MADSFLWQLSFPAATTLLICLLAQYTLCFFLVGILHQLMPAQERASYYLKQPSLSLPWYGLILQPFSNLFSAESFLEEEVRTPGIRRWSTHSPLMHARALNRDMSVSRTSWYNGVILGRNSVFGVFRL